MKATDILLHAADLVGGERDRTHGSKKGNFQRIAAHWNAYIHSRWPGTAVIIQDKDVGLMMALLKIARTTHGSYNADDFTDLAGYAGCAGEIAADDAALAGKIAKEHPTNE